MHRNMEGGTYLVYLITIETNGLPTIIHGERHRLAEATVTREKNAIGQLRFTMSELNPGFDLMRPYLTTVEVIDRRKAAAVFRGRVAMPSPQMGQTGKAIREVVCYDTSSYLRDSTQDYVAAREWADAKAFVTHLLAVHNGKMPAHKQVQPGVIDLDAGAFTREINRGKTWDNLSAFVTEHGGEFRVRDEGTLYLDCSARLGVTRATAIELGRNMVTARREVNPNAVVTRLYLYGAKITEQVTDANGETTEVQTEERVGIESVNDGKPYIEDAVAIDEYGIIEGELFLDDAEDPLELLERGAKWLGENNKMPVTTTLKAIDLSRLGIDPDGFELHDWYPCKCERIGLDDELEIVKQTIDLCNPAASTFDMGETSALTSKNLATLGGLASKVELYQSQNKTAIVNVGNSVKSAHAKIEVMEDSISSKVMESVQTTIVEEVENQLENYDAKDGEDGADAILLVITSDNGTAFEDETGQTTLTANVFRAGRKLSDAKVAELGTIRWYENGLTPAIGEGPTITITARNSTITAQLEA